ncbi:MAG: replication initiation protein, partial [Cetobacterium sp.]
YKNISFELKKEYINLFYNLTGNFTQHKIKEFTSLKSRYAKRIYQIVMSYKGLYKWEFEAKEFRSILDIPDSYGWPDISLKIIKKISKELRDTTNIEDIFLEKIKNGRNIESVILKWKFKVPELLAESDKNKVLVLEKNSEKEESVTRKKLSDESEVIIRAFNNLDENFQKIILEKAQTYFLKESKKESIDGYMQKIWESVKNIYIVKAMKGEI